MTGAEKERLRALIPKIKAIKKDKADLAAEKATMKAEKDALKAENDALKKPKK